jgi:hypothetical protein
MANWKKVVVSGSSAALAGITVDGNIINQGSIDNSHITGSFTGSFTGDGSGLTGLTAETLQATMAQGSTTSIAITSSAGTMLSGSGHIISTTSTASLGFIENLGEISFVGSNRIFANNDPSINIASGDGVTLSLTDAFTVTGGGFTAPSATINGIITNASTVAGTKLTGSFTGSFVGDGSGLTGVTGEAETLQATMAAGSTSSIAITSSAGIAISGSGGIILGDETTGAQMTFRTNNDSEGGAGINFSNDSGTTMKLRQGIVLGELFGKSAGAGTIQRSIVAGPLNKGTKMQSVYFGETLENVINSGAGFEMNNALAGGSEIKVNQIDASTVVGKEITSSRGVSEGGLIIGEYNADRDVSENGYKFIIGTGNSSRRINAFEVSASGDVYISASATVGSLTSGRVTFAGTGGKLSDNIALTYNTDTNTLNVGEGNETTLNNLGISANAITGSNISASTALIAGTAKIADLTDNRVLIAGTGGEIEDSANLTFDGTTLTLGASTTLAGDGTTATFGHVTSIAGITGSVFHAGNLTDNRVLIAGASGKIEDDAKLSFDGTILKVGASISASSGITGSIARLDNLTETRVLFAGSDGVIQDNSGLAFSDNILTVPQITNNSTVDGTHLTGSFTGSLRGILSGNATSATTAAGLSAGATGVDLTLSGDLNVAGTASFTNATNLSVADKYILLSSGSTSAGDGGIVIQQAAGNVGELFGFDSGANRFGITGSFDADTADNFTPDAFMSMVISGSSSNPNNAPARYHQAGNIFCGNDGEIYIYNSADVA